MKKISPVSIRHSIDEPWLVNKCVGVCACVYVYIYIDICMCKYIYI